MFDDFWHHLARFALLSLALLYFFRELRKDRKNITNDTKVGNREDRCMLIFIDGHDILGAFHACQVLNGPADTTGDVESWFNRLAGLPNLVAIGQPARIDDGTRSTGSATQCRSQFLDEAKVFRLAQATTSTDDDAGIFQCRSFAGYLNIIENLDGLCYCVEREVERRILTSSVNCTRTPATLRPVDPIAGAFCASSITTFTPCSLRRKAQEAPTIPAPMTSTSALTVCDIRIFLLHLFKA
jgi:hypothetical protein